MRSNLRLIINTNSKKICVLHHQRTVTKINKTQMVEDKKLAVRKCGELAKARLALEKEYERGEAVPSIDAAKKIADALEVSLDNWVDEGLHNGFDKKTLKRLQELEHLEEDKKKTLYDLVDTYIRDAKGRKTYAA